MAAHPITQLKELGFAVTVNTDNRLQSGTSLTRELTLLVEEAGWTLDDLRDVAVTAAQHTFLHHDERLGAHRAGAAARVRGGAAAGTAHSRVDSAGLQARSAPRSGVGSAGRPVSSPR